VHVCKHLHAHHNCWHFVRVSQRATSKSYFVYIDVYLLNGMIVSISDYRYLSIYLHACEHFVGVALVCNIPHDFVLRAVEDVVQGHCEFRYTQ